MSSPVLKSKEELGQANVDHAEVLANPELMNDAFDAEQREHEQGTWAAAKSHPWACFWAFVMCFTIVSYSHEPPMSQFANMTCLCRLWSRSICF